MGGGKQFLYPSKRLTADLKFDPPPPPLIRVEALIPASLSAGARWWGGWRLGRLPPSGRPRTTPSRGPFASRIIGGVGTVARSKHDFTHQMHEVGITALESQGSAPPPMSLRVTLWVIDPYRPISHILTPQIKCQLCALMIPTAQFPKS